MEHLSDNTKNILSEVFKLALQHPEIYFHCYNNRKLLKLVVPRKNCTTAVMMCWWENTDESKKFKDHDNGFSNVVRVNIHTLIAYLKAYNGKT